MFLKSKKVLSDLRNRKLIFLFSSFHFSCQKEGKPLDRNLGSFFDPSIYFLTYQRKERKRGKKEREKRKKEIKEKRERGKLRK